MKWDGRTVHPETGKLIRLMHLQDERSSYMLRDEGNRVVLTAHDDTVLAETERIHGGNWVVKLPGEPSREHSRKDDAIDDILGNVALNPMNSAWPGRRPGSAPPGGERGSTLVAHAQALTLQVLAREPARADHSAGVAARALALTPTVPATERDTLVAAAWLHDIGYAAELRQSGFHPLDGAHYLRAHGWPARLCDLVAHHSGARFVAAVTGLGDQLIQFGFVEDAVSDALTAADQTTGPHGEALSLDQRLREKNDRHGSDSPTAHAHSQRVPYLRAAAGRVEHRLGLE
ncbi:HD domain-containing protein [Rhodococcus jostii]|uniref:HDIG domain-containing protein n=1 Tax=Rhodococcus jostii TaxID=132919 RepID=A0A1H5MIL2_RHOJO|nr:HD domain-containing protein [Rhodococcus jostii]SEE89235.1 HDIG domain-containing protein [Rhodococcus jostii]